MRIFVNYTLANIHGEVVSNELTIFFDVKTFSDYHQLFYNYIQKNHQRHWVKINRVKVVDLLN